MEEKMRRQKTKGKQQTEKANTLEDGDGHSGTVEEEIEKTTEVEVDVEKEVEVVDDNEHEYQYSTPEMQHITPAPILPPIPKTNVESQRLEIIEIKPDGSTGHLTRNTAYVDEDK